MYSLAESNLDFHARGALDVFDHEGENPLIVIKVNSIPSVVARCRLANKSKGVIASFSIEKFALNVIGTGAIVD